MSHWAVFMGINSQDIKNWQPENETQKSTVNVTSWRKTLDCKVSFSGWKIVTLNWCRWSLMTWMEWGSKINYYSPGVTVLKLTASLNYSLIKNYCFAKTETAIAFRYFSHNENKKHIVMQVFGWQGGAVKGNLIVFHSLLLYYKLREWDCGGTSCRFTFRLRQLYWFQEEQFICSSPSLQIQPQLMWLQRLTGNIVIHKRQKDHDIEEISDK